MHGLCWFAQSVGFAQAAFNIQLRVDKREDLMEELMLMFWQRLSAGLRVFKDLLTL